jgi:UDP:flavonoid glycosyltransferase YjiC (YdhE family)
MKIAWFCIPAHGHTNPTLGLIKTLTEAGHQIWYFSFEEFREKIENAGATFISCDGYDFEMEDKGNADRVGKDKVYATELLVSSTLALDEMTYTVSDGVIIYDVTAQFGDEVGLDLSDDVKPVMYIKFMAVCILCMGVFGVKIFMNKWKRR